jgi:hypothetical protein
MQDGQCDQTWYSVSSLPGTTIGQLSRHESPQIAALDNGEEAHRVCRSQWHCLARRVGQYVGQARNPPLGSKLPGYGLIMS